MSYIGRKPTVGNFQICDAISVVNGQAAYTMQVGSVNVIPETANHMIVSLNGTIQKPNSSFTVSGSTITFSSNLATGDVIDFIQILGDVLDLGVPSDATVTTAKIVDANVTSAKLSYPLTTFSSTGIDDNADALAMTIDSSEQVGIGETAPLGKLHVKTADTGASAVSGNANELVIENTGNVGMTIQSANDGVGNIYFGDVANGSVGRVSYDHSNNFMSFNTNASERMRIDNSGTVLVATTDTSLYNNTSGSGWFIDDLGSQQTASSSRACADWNRLGNDGNILGIYQAGTQEGSISVSGSTVSYNGFTGTHWSRFQDNSTPTILRGTVLETLDEMCYWYNLEFDNKKIPYVLLDGQSDGDVIAYSYDTGLKDEDGEDIIENVQATIVKEVDVKHMMSKVSDTTDAKNVYGVFIAYDLDGEGYNDFYVASVGSFVVRIKQGETIAKGDLLQSNGDGTAKVQSDDNIKSSSFAKVLSTTVIETYEDGSFIVPCSLMC